MVQLAYAAPDPEAVVIVFAHTAATEVAVLRSVRQDGDVALVAPAVNWDLQLCYEANRLCHTVRVI